MTRPVLGNIELPAIDMAATQSFYNEVFGWAWTQYGPTYADAVDASGIEFGLTTAATPAPPPPLDDPSSVGPLVLFRTDDLEAVQSAIVGRGGTIVTQTFEFPGGRRFHFADPSGNVLGVYRLDTD